MQLAVNEIDELSKTQLALGLGTKIIQVDRELVTIEKNIRVIEGENVSDRSKEKGSTPMPFQIQNTKVISNEVQHNKQVSCQRFLHKDQQKDGNKLCVIRCSGNKIFQIDHHAMYPFPTLLWTKSSGW